MEDTEGIWALIAGAVNMATHNHLCPDCGNVWPHEDFDCESGTAYIFRCPAEAPVIPLHRQPEPPKLARSASNSMFRWSNWTPAKVLKFVAAPAMAYRSMVRDCWDSQGELIGSLMALAYTIVWLPWLVVVYGFWLVVLLVVIPALVLLSAKSVVWVLTGEWTDSDLWLWSWL